MIRIHKNMNNQEIARLLEAVGAAYEVKGGNRFKIVAYDRAASAVEHATSELKDLWDEGHLEVLPGIGVGIASHLDELFETGRVKHFDKVMKGLPEAMFELLDIPGVGAKTAFKLTQELKIRESRQAVNRLKKAAEKGQVKRIEGFGEQSEKELLLGIAELERRSKRMLLPQAMELAQKIIAYLDKHPQVEEVYPLGSLRRGCATIGDVDLAAKTDSPLAVIDYFVKYPERKKVTNQGEAKASIILKNGRQVDFRAQKRSFGAMLQYFTGSKSHNIHLRELAQKKDLSLSEYGIKVKGKLKEFESEEDFYRYLGMDWIPPELREDSGEIEAAQAHHLPQLVKTTDIKGEFHTHSNFKYQEPSHGPGKNSFTEIIEQAILLGYEYIGLADHSPSISQHTPQRIISLIARRKKEIEQIIKSKKFIQRKIRGKYREIKIFNVLEVDILPDGRLTVPDEGLEFLDLAFVSVHTAFRLSKKRMTQRILKALDHPKVKFLAHPTGRLLAKREGYELDWEAIFDFCRENEKWLEIDAMQDRLDLPDFLVKKAIQAGVKLVIGSDSHEIESLALMKYGVDVARRGWAEAKDVVNTLPLTKLNDIMRNSK